MTPRIRKLALTAHIILSVGWLGAVAAYLVLALTGLKSSDEALARSVYRSLELIGYYAIVPLCFASLTTGLIQSLGTAWGLFRHYWVMAKFVLTTGGTIILLLHMKAVSQVAALAANPAASLGDYTTPRLSLVVHAVGGLVILFTATVLSLYKPWGRTPYGLRKQLETNTAPSATQPIAGRRSWGVYALVVLVGFFALFLGLHLTGAASHLH